MVGKPFPSGHPLADRRASYAETMAHLGDMPVAIEVLRGALEIAPDWAAGWFRLGEYCEKAGWLDDAAEAWARARDADPSDPFGATLKLELLKDDPLAEEMPAAFVELLFDQYAPRFESSLVEKLSYKGPEILLNALKASGFTQAERALDLGCGTGLMGEALRPYVSWLGGFDISQGMLSEARAKGLYDTLEKQNLSALSPAPEQYDLIVAADVFIYLGALEQIISWCSSALKQEGRIAFTLEEGEKQIELRESRRFAHSVSYVTEVLQHAGFQQISAAPCVLRQDRGEQIRSFTITAIKAEVLPKLSLDGEAEAYA